MKQWNFPESVQAVAKYHHSPADATDYLLEVCLVHIATAMAAILKHSPLKSNMSTNVSAKAWEITGMNKETVYSVIKDVKQQFESSVSAFIPQKNVANF